MLKTRFFLTASDSSTFKQDAVKKNLVFDKDYCANLSIYVDEPKLERAFFNIVHNAVQASPNNAQVWISTKVLSDKNSVQIEIGNSGSYIAAEDIERIFSPRFTKGKANGTGLGLTSSKGIIEEHGGVIVCRSDKEKGTVFSILIPTNLKPQSTPAPHQVSSFEMYMIPSQNELNIALIEDNIMIAEDWLRTFSIDGSMTHFRDPDQFFDSLKKDNTSYNFIISDLNFDGMNIEFSAFDIAEWARKNQIMVALATSGLVDSKARASFDLILEKKAISPQKLLGLVKSTLGK